MIGTTPLGRPFIHGAATALTQVELTWYEKRTEHWIRFGRFAEEKILDRRRRIVSFKPGSVFAFVRWASNDFGTVISRIDGWPKVELVLQAIDAVEAIGVDPITVAPDHWRHVHNRLTAGGEPRPYTRERHNAWLLRRRAEP